MGKERSGGQRMSELKPCPFCGDTYIRPHIIKGGNYTIGCNTVNCVGLHCEGKLFKSEAEAVNAWNRRASDGRKERKSKCCE